MKRLTPTQENILLLKNKYKNLIEKSNSYRIIDEAISDLAAYEAMNIQRKLHQLTYLSN